MDLTIDSFKVAMNEVLENNVHVELAVTKAINNYDRELKADIEIMCEKNVKSALANQEIKCGGKAHIDKKPYIIGFGLIVEAISRRLGL